jgi:cytochrome c-type biogenesis protein CcmH/NrfG
MTETRETLEARKRDLFAAIRTLDADYEDGTLDEAVYRSTRERYEREAADILAQLDMLAQESRPVVASPPQWRRPMALGLTLLVIGGIIAVILLGAIQRRDENRALSQTASRSPTPTSAALTKAMEAVLKNPRSAAAQLALGNAYFKLGETSQADIHYQAAAQLAPSDPRPVTLHAMVLGSGSRRAQALRILKRVEEAHPGYARAWLLDGLLSSHARATYPRAIRSWKRFLALQPNGPVAANVRHLIAATRKAESSKK